MANTVIKRFLKISAWVLLGLFLSTGALIYSIRIPAVQTWIVKRVAGYLSRELNTTVYVDGVAIDFFSKVRLNGILIKDLKNDTVLQANEITALVDFFAPSENKIYLSEVTLKKGIFKIQRYGKGREYNIDFLIDYFTPAKKDTTAAKFDFNPGEIKLENMVFVYRDHRYNDKSSGIDFDDIRLEHLDAIISEIKPDSLGLLAKIDNLSFQERSGFKIDYLEGISHLSYEGSSFEEVLIKTPFSNINCDLKFMYDSLEDLSEFVTNVRIQSEFQDCDLDSRDLSYFAPELQGMNRKINLSGKIKGTIDHLKGKDLEINYGQNTLFNGNISISGLPDIDESYFDLQVKSLQTDYNDLTTIPSYPFNLNNTIALPDQIKMAGQINARGQFNGFLTDFVAYGNFNSSIGFISSDVNFKVNGRKGKPSYSGHLSAIDLNIGQLANNTNKFGKTSFNTIISGSGVKLSDLDLTLKGDINSLGILGYEYHKIKVDGIFSEKKFNGFLAVSDSNLTMDFSGGIDLKSKIPVYDFNTEIKNARPTILGMINRDSSSQLSLKGSFQLVGTDFDDITGSVMLNDLNYSESGKTFLISEALFKSEMINGNHLTSLKSDIADIELSGTYKRTELPASLEYLIRNYIPTLKKGDETSHQTNVKFSCVLKETRDLTSILLPEIQVTSGTRISGFADSENNSFRLEASSDSLRVGESLFAGIESELNTKDGTLSFNNRFQKVVVNDTLVFIKPYIQGTTDKNHSNFTIASDSRDTLNNDVVLNGEASYDEQGKTIVRILKSDIILNGKKWQTDEDNTITIDSSIVTVKELFIRSGDESAGLSGVLSGSVNDKLKLSLDNFRTESINPLLAVYGFRMAGIATGEAEFSGLLKSPGISGNMSIKDLGVYDDTLGNADLKFDFDSQRMIVTANGLIERAGAKNIEVSGKYFIAAPHDSMDFTISLQKTGLSAFAGYASGIISDIRGKATGILRLTGNFSEPILTGKLRLQQTSFLFDYLNTRYSLSDEIEFTERYINLKGITVNDENGNKAIVDGKIYHKNLRDFTFKIDINTNNLQMMNTSASQNELYYGKAYGSGRVRITGTLDIIKISMALKTEKNTQIFIPLSNPEEVIKSSYINFVNKDQNFTTAISGSNQFSGIEMDFELDVTPDAEVQLIFDSKIGDIIKGRGNGNLQMEVNTEGDFKMFGNFRAESGDYLFTLQNLINKKFIIQPGGTIKWTGDPYDAEVDIKGVYKLKASLYDLIKDTTLTKRIPVEVNLRLKDKLFNPAISFDVVIPDIDPTAQALMNRYISTEQEKSTQTMSLLVLGRFARAADVEAQGTASSSGVGANAAELLSQQLSVWASQISDVVNVGVNYRAADAFSQEELDLALSTQLWNDRITIDGTVGLSDKQRNTTSGLVGDFNAEVKVSKDGRFRFKVFNKTINNVLSNYNSPYTQGIGILYRKEFDTVGELFTRKIKEEAVK